MVQPLELPSKIQFYLKTVIFFYILMRLSHSFLANVLLLLKRLSFMFLFFLGCSAFYMFSQKLFHFFKTIYASSQTFVVL